jgi:alkyl hydroperoxide reductase subunit AhpC
MTMQINSTAPDFEAETTEGKIKFHDWIGDSWAVLVLAPEGFYACLHHGTRHASVRSR